MSNQANPTTPINSLHFIFGVAALALALFGIHLTFDVYQARQRSLRMADVNRMVDQLFDFNTELMLERGLGTLRLMRPDATVASRLATQRAVVDREWERLEQTMGQLWPTLNDYRVAAITLDRIRESLPYLRMQRAIIDQWQPENGPVDGYFFGWFSMTSSLVGSVGMLADQILPAINGLDSGSLGQLSLKRQLWLATENIGMLRAQLVYHSGQRHAAGPAPALNDLDQQTHSIEQLTERLRIIARDSSAAEIAQAFERFAGQVRDDLLPAARAEIDALRRGRSEFDTERWFGLASDVLLTASQIGAGQSQVIERRLQRAARNRQLQLLAFLVAAVVAFAVAIRTLRRVRAQTRELHMQRELAEITLRSIGDAVITTNASGQIEYLNPPAEDLTGWSLFEARGRPYTEVVRLAEIADGTAIDPVTACLEQGRVIGLGKGHRLIRRDGSTAQVEESAAPIRDRDNQIAGVLLVFIAIEQHSRDHLLVYQATHDPLTGLINRREFERRLEALLDRARSQNESHVLAYLDLDQFKVVNDTCGHAAGDEMLRQVVFLLRQRIRESDVLGRLGGDEFGLLLLDCTLAQAQALAETLRSLIKDFRFQIADRMFTTGLSIGLIPIAADSAGIDDLLHGADAACFMAKERGRNRIHCYAAEDLDRARRHGDLQWAPRLTTALQENRLELFGQRLQPLTPGLPERVEVLLRLRERDGTLIAPMAFIPAAERYGLIAELDRWVVKNTIEAIAGLDFTAGAPIFNINLSGDSLADDRLIDLIRGAATRHGVPPSALCFEVAETAAIRNLTQTSKLMTRLGAEGYTFALDDFGSGLSSFNYLKNLPVHAIKIDGSFIRALQPDSLDYVMVQATAQIGRLLGKRTMAESVELEETLLLLRQIGVDYAQGFHLGRPEPLRQFIAGNGTGVPRKATGC